MDEEDQAPTPEALAVAREFWANWFEEEIRAGRTMTVEESWARSHPDGESLDEFTDRMMAEWFPESATE